MNTRCGEMKRLEAAVERLVRRPDGGLKSQFGTSSQEEK